MPVNKRYPLSTSLLPSLHAHFPLPVLEKGREGRVGRRTRRRRGPVALEYVMMEGVNDGEEDAERLAAMTEGVDCVVNLIEFNTHEGRRGKQGGRVEGGREGSLY
jgi:23S rRNA (adenine2503-C2)-methyltransferase